MQESPNKGVPVQTLRRMPSYLGFLRRLAAAGREAVSCTHIAEDLGLSPILVRKDLQYTGIVGRPKVGYSTTVLIAAIEHFLGWDNTTEAVLVGVGSLGHALLGYDGFERHGLRIVAGFDIDPNKVGAPVSGKQVFDLAKLADLVERLHIHLGVLAVPADAAQSAADTMVYAGIQAIWNFSGVRLELAPDVLVEDVDLSASLAVLSNKLESRAASRVNEG